MKINILCVGKIKEKFYRDAIDEYRKRLSRFANVVVTEVKDEKTAENLSDRELEVIKDAEGKRLKEHIQDRDLVIALAIDGKKYDSVAFSKLMESEMNQGHSSFVFVIGGSLGLSDDILKRADIRLSFSDMTFPHQLMRVILLEQVYRGMKIMNHEPYHK